MEGDTKEKARERHDEALLRVLKRARKCNLKFNRHKLRLHLEDFKYIGHWISSAGV